MKRSIIILVLTFAAATLMAQNNLDSLFSEFQRRIPYVDTVAQVSITKATINQKKHHVLFTINLDGEMPLDNDKDLYLYYLVGNPDWDLETLFDNGYSLRILVTTTRNVDRTNGTAYVTYEYSMDEMGVAIITYQANSFLGRYARNTQADCPIRVNDDSYIVACRYDSMAHEFHLVQDADDANWPVNRIVITDDLEGFAHIQAKAFAADTTDDLALALYYTGTTLVQTFRNASHTDSVQIRIAPWMFEEIWKAEEAKGAADELQQNLEVLAFFARNTSARCPQAVDSITTMTSVVFDTAARLLTYTYSVPELTMLNIQHSPQFISAISNAIRQNAIDAKPGSDMYNFFTVIVQCGVTVRYHYTSPRNTDPLSIEITPEEIGSLLQPAPASEE